MKVLNRDSMTDEPVGIVKKLIGIVGKNLLSYLCLLAPVAVIGCVWFDVSPVVALRKLSGGIPFVAVLVFAEWAMIEIGREAGKRDKDMLAERDAFLAIRGRVIEVGTARMSQFCDEEIPLELEDARKTACRRLGLDYKVYLEKYAKLGELGKGDLRKTIGDRVIAAKVYAVNMIKPIELSEELILNDSHARRGRGGIGKTGDEYIDRKRGLRSTISSILSVLVFTGIVVGPAMTFSWELVVYTLWALMILIYRMARGYKDGVAAYAVVQVKNYRDRSRYCEKYLEWIGRVVGGS